MNNIKEEIQNIKTETLPEGALLKCIVMDGPGLIALLRPSDLKLLFVNRQFEYYLGYTNKDITETEVYFSDLFEDYLFDRFMYQLNLIKSDRAAYSRYVIYPLKGKNGVITPFYLYASPVLTNNVEMYHLVMHPDLSKWNMPFTSFTTRELFLEQFDSEDFGTFEWIMSVDKVFWSVGMYRIFEIEDKHFDINKSFFESFTHPGDRERVKKDTGLAIAGGTDLNIEYRIVTAKEEVKIVHCLARIIKNPAGTAMKFVGSIRDVTEARQIEEDLKNKVEELNHSNRELEEFAYIASHDMQEPLRKIATFGDRLSEKYKDVLTGDGLMYLSRMAVSAENMRSLINGLLEFSRISKARQPFEPVNLNLMLKEVKNEFELTIEETGTVINSQVLPVINAVPVQMKQLFANIISNAIKFRKRDIKPVITIETSMPSEEEKINLELQQHTVYHKIIISDNGIGFENEYNARIFQVFQRLHGKSEYPGSGIGLAICKKILEYHNGVIYGENVPGAGARFIFILPEHQPKPKEN